MAAILGFYLIQIGFEVSTNHLFEPMGSDFLAFWSAGRAADLYGYGSIYDLEKLATIQLNELSTLNKPVDRFFVFPVALFSLFVIPFQLLSKINLSASYLLWTTLNFLALFTYLVFFFQKTRLVEGVNPLKRNVIFFMFISLPVFQNFYWGQVEVFLMIFVGEFIRAALARQPVKSGLWLGGLLLKPQILVLILPAFLIMRNWKLILGFVVTFVTIIMTSLLLSGSAGMRSLLDLWIRFVPGVASNSPENMMNWRMVGVHINQIVPSSIGWVFTGVGMVITMLIVFALCRGRPGIGTNHWLMVVFGVFSATLVFTWHSHLHMAMGLIPFLLYENLRQTTSQKLIDLWVFLPPTIMVFVLLIGGFSILTKLPITSGYGGLLLGMSGLFLNMYILISIYRYSNSRT